MQKVLDRVKKNWHNDHINETNIKEKENDKFITQHIRSNKIIATDINSR